MPERKPTRTADLDYFYGQSSELFSFYRIPKLLFQDSRFQPLSTDAKTLYGILLDRMSLSARNGWLDKAGRVFIIYTVQEVQDSLGCADKKATKLLRELEEYGLIERKRRGLGKPDLIYVKNFSSESSKLRFLNRDNDDSGTVQNTLQDPAKLRCNKTERNNTEISDTDPIYSDENDWMSEREQLEEYFSQSLEVDLLLRLCPDDEDTIYQIVDLLVDTCATNRKTLRIAGDDKPAEVVRSRFMKLNADHILQKNILCGDALTMEQSDGSPIVFAEWSFPTGNFIKQRDYRLDVLLKENTDNDAYSDQLSLFADEPDGTENWMIDPVTHETIPRPLREYQPVDYRRVQENG